MSRISSFVLVALCVAGAWSCAGAPAEGGAGGGSAGGGGTSAAGGGAATGGGAGGGSASGAFTPGPSGCQALMVQAGVSVSGYISDRYVWSDSACQPRSAALVRNNARDPGGTSGGFMRELRWRSGGSEIIARGGGGAGWNGWGYVVNHYASTAAGSEDRTGTWRTVFAGPHHALHEFKHRQLPGGPVDVTVNWFFASGRSHPIYFITYDVTPAGPDVVRADTRAPYGDFNFEGTAGAIGGVEWGDKYRFITTGSGPVTQNSAWDYTQPNVVPFVRMWSQAADAEMGEVQTETWEGHLAGGDYGGGMLATQCWGKTSANKGAMCSSAGWTMPTDWLWPFQLNQYELPFADSSHRIAWGSTYGAIGSTSCTSFGKTVSGYPTVAYSVFLTVGQKSAETTRTQVTQVERAVAAQVTASVGGPAAYDPAFAVWRVPLAADRATVAFNPAGGAVASPIFRFTGYSRSTPPQVTVDGQPFTGAFVSVDAASQTLWVTLNGTVTGPLTVHVE